MGDTNLILKESISSGDGRPSQPRFGNRLLGLGLFLMVLISAGGWFYYQYQSTQARKAARESLATIADLKAEEISNWLRERQGDAEVARTSVIAKGVVTNPDNPGAREAALTRSEIFRQVYGYAAVVYADAQGRIQLKVPADYPLSDASLNKHIQAALHSQKVQIADLNRDTTNGPILMWLECPIFSDFQTNSALAGAAILVIDPHTFLYPTINKWPAPSQTAETVMVRREGDDVVRLNDRRFSANSALNVRVSITANPQRPMVMAVQGVKDVVEGVDYRGKSVFWTSRKIEGMPWFMFMKIDKEEVLAPLHKEAWEVGIITALLLVASMLGVGLLWRQQKLADVHANEARLQMLIEQAPLAISISREGRYVYANQKFLNLYGYKSVEDLVGQPVSIHWTPEFREIIKERVRKRERGESVSPEYEGTAQRKDGSQFPVHVAIASVELPDGHADLAFIADITERKRAEEELRQKTALLEAQLNSSIDGILVIDDQGKKILQNRRTTELWNIPRHIADSIDGQAQVQHVMQMTKNPAQFAEKIAHLYRHPEEISHDEVELSNGTVLDRYSAPVLGEDGHNYGRIWIFRDISERKRAEAALRFSEAQLRATFEGAAIGVALVNPEGRSVKCNPALCRMLGYSESELSHVAFPEVTHPEDVELDLRLFRSLLAGERDQYEIEKRYIRKDGQIIWGHLNVSLVKLSGSTEPLAIRMVEDITERRKLEEQFRQSQKMEGIGQLAGGVAHDFNNILAVIQMQSELLKRSGGLSASQAEFADEIGTTVQRAAALTRQLLLFSRKEIMHQRDLDLNQSINDMTKMLRRTIGEDIQLQFKFAMQPLFVHADAGMMDQVLMNLCVNARDAMSKGGTLVIETSAVEFDELAASKIPQARQGSFVRLSVSDTGCGIPPENMQKIFEPFFTTKDVGKGTGLGLATVFGIAQQHQGWVNVFSEVGKGTTFRIYLPRLEKMSGQKSTDTTFTTLTRGKETILLVEDDASLRASVSKALSQLGYRVLEAINGVEALEIWKQHRDEIYLLLTDMVMPGGITGIDLAERLLKENPKLKVIYASGYSAEVAGKDFPLEEGVNFLTKPFKAAKLAKTIRARLDD